jgi:hypothetical protein
MNRRKFFGLTAGLGAALALPDYLLEEDKGRRTFLPPRGGWWNTTIRMRETRQWTITDDILMRWDVAWEAPDGEHHQLYCYLPQTEAEIVMTFPSSTQYINECRETARRAIEGLARDKGLLQYKQKTLMLPPHVEAKYV